MYLGQWGLAPWFEETGPDLVHAEDLDAFRQLLPYGKLFKCVADDVQYLTIQYAKETFRIKPQLFRVVPEPRKKIGDEVRVKVGEVTKMATVYDVNWHFQKGQPFFFLIIDGKSQRKRYWTEDFWNDAGYEVTVEPIPPAR